MMTVNNIRIANQHRTFDRILEFTYVSGKMVGGQHIDRRGGDAAHTFFMFALVFLKKMLRE